MISNLGKMIHITEQDYRKIKEDLREQAEQIQNQDCGEEVSTTLEKDGCLIDISGMGYVCVYSHKIWDEAWGRGGWFTQYDYHYELDTVIATAYDENDERVETDFDPMKVEGDWD